MRRRRTLAPAALLALAVITGLAPTAALAASPEPDPFPTIETWIDAPLAVPPDAPAGAQAALGVTLWDVRNHELWSMDGLVAKLYPNTGKAKPSAAPLVQDAPGHLVAMLTVPQGGAGRVEVVTQDRQCKDDGTCTTVDRPLKLAGTGPPPDAPRSQLVRTQLLPVVGDVVAGRPAPIAVVLTPIGLWDPPSLDLPTELQVVVTRVGGGNRLGSAQLQQITPEFWQPYQGAIRVPETGEMALTAALVGPNGTTDPIDGELGRVLVIQGGTRPDTTPAAIDRPSPAASDGPATSSSEPGREDGPPILLIGAIVVLVLGLALFLGEPLSRRFRGGRPD